MLRRCEDVSNVGYANYGGRGITVCPEWHDFERFKEWALVNSFAPELVIDRIDNNGPYSPENCHYVTPTANARNKRNCIYLTIFSETKTVAEWAQDPRCAVPRRTLYNRVHAGIVGELAISLPSFAGKAYSTHPLLSI